MGLLIPTILVAFCSIVIWRSVDGFTVASDYLGRNLSDGVKGATINAIASSMPELFTTIFFLFFLNDVDGFSGGIGTTAGSAIFNSMIIPAVAILAVIYAGMTKVVTVSKKVIRRDGIALILTEGILIVLIGLKFVGVFLKSEISRNNCFEKLLSVSCLVSLSAKINVSKLSLTIAFTCEALIELAITLSIYCKVTYCMLC